MIILDIGSCHEGNKTLALEAIKEAKVAGADALKFQLFEPDKYSENVALPPEWMSELVAFGKELGINVFASVFSEAMLTHLTESGATHCKIAYSRRKAYSLVSAACMAFPPRNVFVSYGAMEIPIPNVQALYCHTISDRAIYPVEYYLSFGSLFRDGRFCGFSDHTLGYMQAATAYCSGAKVIEKHVKFVNTPLTIPDARFAITFEEAAAMVKLINTKGQP